MKVTEFAELFNNHIEQKEYFLNSIFFEKYCKNNMIVVEHIEPFFTEDMAEFICKFLDNMAELFEKENSIGNKVSCSIELKDDFRFFYDGFIFVIRRDW